MIKVYIAFIVAIVVVGLIGWLLWKLFCKTEEETAASDKLIAGAVDVILASLPSFSDTAMQFLYDLFQIEKTATESGLSPKWLIAVGFVLLIVGVILKFIETPAGYVILNMPGTIHHTKKDGMLKALKIQNCEEIETNTANCQTEMQRLSKAKVNAIIADIQTQMTRFNTMSRSNRCFTGMAPIPFVICAGTKHEGSDIKCYLEFNKATQQYTKLNNDKDYPVLNMSSIIAVEAEEIVVAVSTTALINDANTSQFDMPVFSLSLAEPKDNAIFSKKQPKQREPFPWYNHLV